MGNVWKKTLVSLGLMDEEEDGFSEGYEDDPAPRRDEAQMVRTVSRNERNDRPERHPAGRGVVRQISNAQPRQMHVCEPRIYDDSQDIADRFRSGMPVIINLRLTEQAHKPKVLQFTSGVVYALNGRMQAIAENVYLLTPFNMEVSADEKRRLAEHGLFGGEF